MRKKLVIILNCILILGAGLFSAFGQEKTSDLKDKRIIINMEKQSLGVVFRYLIDNYDVAVGFEESVLDRDHNDYDFDTFTAYVKELNIIDKERNKRASITLKNAFKAKDHWITINAENERLEDVLNQIVKQMKYYKWEINDEVVNIFPLEGRDERFRELLEIPIKDFTFNKSSPIKNIKVLILELPEIKMFLDENKILSIASYIGLTRDLERSLSADINFSNLTFGELLNKITKVKRGGWKLRRSKIFKSTKEKEYIDIDI